MSLSPASPLQAPPLPRLRYHSKTGTWKKELLNRTRASPRTTVSTLEHVKGTSLVDSQRTVQFESSFDYFLRQSIPFHRSTSRTAIQARQARDTEEQIRLFERRWLKQSNRVSFVQHDVLEHHHSTFSPNVHIADDSSTDSEVVAHRAVPHLITGLVASLPLYSIFETLTAVKGRWPLFPTSAGGLEEEAMVEEVEAEAQSIRHSGRLSWTDFQSFLSLLEQDYTLTASYAEHIFLSLPSYDCHTHSIDVFTLFSYLVDARRSKHLFKNVEMIFKACDIDKRGLVTVEALNPRVLKAWAELNTYGNLQNQWMSFADALMLNRMHTDAVQPLLCDLMNPEMLRAYLSSSELLYSAATSLDLEGGTLGTLS